MTDEPEHVPLYDGGDAATWRRDDLRVTVKTGSTGELVSVEVETTSGTFDAEVCA